MKFENVWAGTYATFAKVAAKTDVYVFGLNNYGQLGYIKSLLEKNNLSKYEYYF